MKPLGYPGVSKHQNCTDKKPHRSCKNWKRGEKHKLKQELKKEKEE